MLTSTAMRLILLLSALMTAIMGVGAQASAAAPAPCAMGMIAHGAATRVVASRTTRIARAAVTRFVESLAPRWTPVTPIPRAAMLYCDRLRV